MSQARPLRPLGGWELISRGRFEVRHHGHVWTVDLDYFDFGEKLHLYRDGVEVEVQTRTSTRADQPPRSARSTDIWTGGRALTRVEAAVGLGFS